MQEARFLTLQEIFDRAVAHLKRQKATVLLAGGGGAYRTQCGGCPVGNFLRPSDYRSTMEGVPVRFIRQSHENCDPHMEAGIAALRKGLLRSGVNVFDEKTVELLSCLQNVHDIFGRWEWGDRLRSVASQFEVSAESVKDL